MNWTGCMKSLAWGLTGIYLIQDWMFNDFKDPTPFITEVIAHRPCYILTQPEFCPKHRGWRHCYDWTIDLDKVPVVSSATNCVGANWTTGVCWQLNRILNVIIKVSQVNFKKSVKILWNWTKTYDRNEFLALSTCILIGVMWLLWFLRYGIWTDFHKFCQKKCKMREKWCLTAWDHKNTPKYLSLMWNAWDLECL